MVSSIAATAVMLGGAAGFIRADATITKLSKESVHADECQHFLGVAGDEAGGALVDPARYQD